MNRVNINKDNDDKQQQQQHRHRLRHQQQTGERNLDNDVNHGNKWLPRETRPRIDKSQ